MIAQTPEEERDAARGHGFMGRLISNHVAANLLMLFLIIGGLLTLLGMRSEVFPSFSLGTVQVSVPYPGATPAEVEDGVTRRMEEAILGTDGIERVTSTAFENRGTVTVELKDFADPQVVKDDVQTAIDGISDFPPADAEQPQVVVVEPTSGVVSFVITGEADERTLRTVGERLERDLLSLPEVSTVALRGVRDYEISIEVSEDALRGYGLTLEAVARTVRSASLDLSAGTLRTEGGEILLRTPSKARTGEEFEQIVLRTNEDGSILRLSDVATVVDGFEDGEIVSLYNGRPAIFLDVQRTGDSDIIQIREAALAYVEGFEPPPGIEVIAFRDQTEILEDRINLLSRNAILGFALVFLLLVLTLDLKLALWVAMGVPISFLGGFLIFGSAGLSLNMISLFGLIIVIGIVVDDAIVVGENIYAEQEKRPGIVGAIVGSQGIMPPVLVGVLTTMAAFAPLIFTGGTFGKILQPVPIVVIAVLFVSLIEAFFILPSHLSSGGRWSAGPLLRLQNRIASGVHWAGNRLVVPLARFSATFRYPMLAAAVGLILVIGGLLSGGFVRIVFFPTIEGTEMTANLTMPDGTPFDTTRAAAEKIVAAAEDLRADIDAERADQMGSIFQSVAVTIGGRGSGGGGPGARNTFTVASNLAQVQIELAPASRRDISSRELERRWRERVGAIAGAEQLTFNASIGPQANDVSYELAHAEEAKLVEATERLREEIARLEGVSQIDDSYDLGKREISYTLTEAGKAAGLQPQDLARTLRRAFFGEEVQRIQRGREEVRVYVRYPQAEREVLTSLDDLRIRLPDGSEAPLSVVAEAREQRSLASITRVDGRRVVTVTADVDEAVTTPNDVNAEIQENILPRIVDRLPGLQWSVEGAAREQSEDFASLANGAVLALMVIYGMLATVLRSYVQPLIILAAIPLGFAGAVLGHLVLGYDMSFVSLLGFVALSGVVINSSVVLVDRYNRLVAEGEDLVPAIVEATRSRFRPIMLTTLSTALGLLPIISETSPQAQFLIPMAISLAAGLVFSSVLMLAVLPALTMAVQDLRHLMGTRRPPAQPLGDTQPAE